MVLAGYKIDVVTFKQNEGGSAVKSKKLEIHSHVATSENEFLVLHLIETINYLKINHAGCARSHARLI